MTIRDSINRHVRRIRLAVFGGFALCAIFGVASSYGFRGPLPGIAAVIAITGAFVGVLYARTVGVPCPRCGGNLVGMVLRPPRALWENNDYQFCPYCRVDVDGPYPSGGEPAWDPDSDPTARDVKAEWNRRIMRYRGTTRVFIVGFVAVAFAVSLYIEGHMIAVPIGLVGIALVVVSLVHLAASGEIDRARPVLSPLCPQPTDDSPPRDIHFYTAAPVLLSLRNRFVVAMRPRRTAGPQQFRRRRIGPIWRRYGHTEPASYSGHERN